ncbi:MAG: M28 family peptidase [Planctomycetota bacterium]|nr:M28 family peptidase [Planctomycetota bacterium]
MHWTLLSPVFAGLLISASTLQTDSDPTPLAPANAAIEISSMKAHMGFLTSDELRGREAFTEDALKAAQYLRACLKQAGVAPGWNGEYFQPAPFEKVTEPVVPRLVLTGADGKTHALTYGSQFRVGGRRGLKSLDSLAVVPVQPEGQDTADQLKGKAVLFQGSSREWRTWWKQHSEDGIALVLRYRTGKKERKLLDRSPDRITPAWGERKGEGDVPVLTLYGELDGMLASVSTASIESQQKTETIHENNVVGVIPGVGTPEDPDMAKQVIVISAHYDHVGTRSGGPEEDTVFNGADDDASGVVVLLELAEAMAAGDPPARTFVFLLAAAEEKGILGTEYFVENPPFPLENIVCNLNLEMLGRPDDLVGGSGKLWLSGFERSNLGPMFQAAGIPVVEDKRPEMNFFSRSDNIVFVRKGVVGQTLSSYNMHKDYHQVSDEMATIDFEHLAGTARGALAAALLLSNAKERPSWNEGEPKGFLPK